ncbi:esterase [Serratia sp. AS12]|uniref:enterochelin esterase n=1 Tax=Serratia TaxID=613 RepID=UPI00020E9D88|nr:MULTISPECIES: enterochelin esterase [Serratia]AEF46731.1 esterase [Serratia plymuthica AS9]AEF51683.1 esterase [Serratia sp. AS12]AEG29390.1 esterase [Serratia sp. AS13]UTN95431.1 enterochelin esterase [Serratia plymuthica]
MKTKSESESSRLLSSKHAGRHGWWLNIAKRGTPLVELQGDGRGKVTFLWRDPQGCELTSAYRRVWIHINCLTDHHQPSPPQSLQRLEGTDVWYWQTELNADWRGSYCFMPCMDDRPLTLSDNDAHANMHSVRHWWHQVFASATHDLLNPHRSWSGANGNVLSGLHMPAALPQPAWQDFDRYASACGRCTPAPPARLQRHSWHSARLGNTRNVWVYTTGDSNPAQRPLALLLDGQFWSSNMPVWDPLMQLTREGKLPEAVYLLIDVIDQKRRAHELACNEDFWLAVQEELLPQLAEWAPHSDNPASTLVCGQSFGGLSSLYAGLHWPQRFGGVIAQSGSFWWPRRDMYQQPAVPADAGWLLRQAEQGVGRKGGLKVFMEAGTHEQVARRVNDRMADVLRDAGHRVQYRVVEGGHDSLCWRGGLIDGLQALWADQPAAPFAKLTFKVQGVRDGNSEPVR